MYALSKSSHKFEKHFERGWFQLRFNKNDTDGSVFISTKVVSVDDPKFEIRNDGWWLWIAWCLLSVIMVTTRRYMSFAWLTGTVIHSIIGLLITGITLFFSFVGMQHLEWRIDKITQHTFIAIAAFAFTPIMAATGVTIYIIGYCYRGTKRWSNHNEAQVKVGKFHKYFGWFMIFFGIATSSSGLAAYQDEYNNLR